MGAMPATSDRTWLPPDRPLTVDDLEAMPDDGRRYELLDGVLLVSPAPRLLHQRIVMQLGTLLNVRTPSEFEVLSAPFAVHPDESQSMELQPDLLVAVGGDLTDRDLPATPLLAVEVLSPSTRMVDLTLKRAAYERMGTPSYWVLDPDVPDLRVFELDGAEYRLVAHVRGEEAFEATRPFPVTVRPAALLRRDR